ncbi:Elf1-domain-containing protein, partial [Caulochytrium protostelioides]
MGKRKSKRVAPKRAKTSLDTAFNCVFCNHDNSVTVKLDRNMNIGNLSCRACGVSFQSHVNYLSEPIDVYSDWLDACE